jgi:hypothetical protein
MMRHLRFLLNFFFLVLFLNFPHPVLYSQESREQDEENHGSELSEAPAKEEWGKKGFRHMSREEMEKRLTRIKEHLKRLSELEEKVKNSQGEERIQALTELVLHLSNHDRMFIERIQKRMEKKLSRSEKKEKK